MLHFYNQGMACLTNETLNAIMLCKGDLPPVAYDFM